MRTDTFSFCRSALPDPTIQNRNWFALSAFRARPLSGVPNVKTLSTFGDQEKLGELFRKINVKTRIQKCKIRRRLTWGKQYRYMSVVTVWYAHGAKNRKIAKYIKYLKPPKGDKVVRWFAGLWFWVGIRAHHCFSVRNVRMHRSLTRSCSANTGPSVSIQ